MLVVAVVGWEWLEKLGFRMVIVDQVLVDLDLDLDFDSYSDSDYCFQCWKLGLKVLECLVAKED